MASRVIQITDNHKIDLSKAKTVGVSSKEDFMDMLKSGEVLVYDTKSGKFITNLFGVPLPSANTVVSKVTSLEGASKIM